MARREDKTTDDNIILTGFMGTGKSSVGRLLAEHLGYEFVDTDEWIAARCGKAIHDIFRDQGEAAFREMEAAFARELGGLKKKVIATGGRLMLDAANAAALSRAGRVFTLWATPEEIMARVANDTAAVRVCSTRHREMDSVALGKGGRPTTPVGRWPCPGPSPSTELTTPR